MMIPPRELAAQLAGRVFDHVETERTLIRHSIEEVLHDGLLLGLAKQAAAPSLMSGGAASQEVMDAAKRLCKLLVSDTTIWGGIPNNLGKELDALYLTLRRTGWQP